MFNNIAVETKLVKKFMRIDINNILYHSDWKINGLLKMKNANTLID